ncbi:MAG TPA: hypothetical protein DCX25_04605 [Candidatus Pacebacteria bacterium]|nr:MAG: Ion transport 2 domain-containing protein [Microgenomates group bacterium GW2011_GWB1_45_17]KKU23393.1 MAG: Ion transport 2 domain-containing protein [Microgenomates group bacterium GW2011_GWA1_46_15]KKU24477.1 MAG: Ion transport 2 domain-containing protein [Microgenomates group bacterium GW2011_GWC1_46_15]HAV15581.1 hypothetical protein [Candidatus Paceibacterota bacterium]HCR10907.1 hypothetical protein [Candidatus Paceibacterota bacterium]
MSGQSHRLTRRLFHHRKFRTVFVLILIFTVVLGFTIVPIEATSPLARIHTSEEGLWWAVTTVTGVGYGDFVPITTLGRVVGALLQISGVLMFGLIIGIIGVTLTKRQEEYSWFRLFDRLDQLEEKLNALEKKSKFLIHNGEEKG